MVFHTFSSITGEVEERRMLNWRSGWITYWLGNQPELQSVNQSQKKQKSLIIVNILCKYFSGINFICIVAKLIIQNFSFTHTEILIKISYLYQHLTLAMTFPLWKVLPKFIKL
jgi:hypothetical protein